jgi:ferredoxin
MITGKQKTIAEISRLIESYRRILVLGCGTCVTVCFAGGEKEAIQLASSLRLKNATEEGNKEFTEYTIRRQCEWEYLDDIRDRINSADAVLSIACGIGVQAIAEHFPDKIALPGLNTTFMGIPEEAGVWAERCLACGDCVLGLTWGICPITRCAKSLFNGPCGGSSGGKCEVSPETPCAWQLIYDRASKLGELDKLSEIQPIRDWRTSHSGGPRKIVREDLKTIKKS